MYDEGRIAACVVNVGMACPLLVYTAYGWSGSASRPDLRAKTSLLAQGILDDISLQPPLPVFVMGDFNAAPEDLPP
eukprot:2595003-Alexandrium_andersonii.AAC.1